MVEGVGGGEEGGGGMKGRKLRKKNEKVWRWRCGWWRGVR